MNNSLLMPIMDTNIIMVKVRFRQSDVYKEDQSQKFKKTFRPDDDPAAWSGEYTYKAHTSLHLKVGDTVMVQARNWYQIARVSNVDVAIPMDDNTTKYRWIAANVSPAMAELMRTEARETSITQQLDRKRAEAARMQALDALGITPQEAALLTST